MYLVQFLGDFTGGRCTLSVLKQSTTSGGELCDGQLLALPAGDRTVTFLWALQVFPAAGGNSWVSKLQF